MTDTSVPAPYGKVTPYLCIAGAAKALDFYNSAFGAKERVRIELPNGLIAHAEIMIGDSIVMLSDVYQESGLASPRTLGGSSVSLNVYVPDVDSIFIKAIEAGATKVCGLQNRFYGDRSGTVRDPFGHVWAFATRKEEITVDELKRRALDIYSSLNAAPAKAGTR
ncbi:VOC family protein [Methylocystis rosea]|uniref:VOC family protein n=1 Tax=Methylocystis rosea TaxID=173366 RepID=UPI0003815F95|nr:VOC family protein [Methylocystis rosea]